MKNLLFLAFLTPFFTHAQSLKNLDIKNGFLQFHLGDSLSTYKKDIYIAYKNHPDENEVKPKSLALHKYLDKVTLISKDGIVTEIDVMIRMEPSEVYIDGLMTAYYGPGTELPDPEKNEPGMDISYTTWTGTRVMAIIVQTNINRPVNNIMTRARFQSIVFKMTGDSKVAGELPPDFKL